MQRVRVQRTDTLRLLTTPELDEFLQRVGDATARLLNEARINPVLLGYYVKPTRLALAVTLLMLGYWVGGYSGLAAAALSLLVVLSPRKSKKYTVRLVA